MNSSMVCLFMLIGLFLNKNEIFPLYLTLCILEQQFYNHLSTNSTHQPVIHKLVYFLVALLNISDRYNLLQSLPIFLSCLIASP